MPGISTLSALMQQVTTLGVSGPHTLSHSLANTAWVGPIVVQVADGVTEQSVIFLGTQGLTTITACLLTSDQAISVTLGVAGTNVPVPLSAGGLLALSGTSLTALSITNASGTTANVTILAGGA